MRDVYNPGHPFTLRSSYGSRIDPINKTLGEFHAGLDYAAPAGTPIPAATSGVVVYSGKNETFGNVVLVRNAAGNYSLYGHMQDGDRVKVGQQIWPGDTIGSVGSTGRSKGPHLHYSIITPQAGKGVENPALPGNGGPIGVKVNEDNTIDPAKYDPAPYLDESQRAARIMSGGNANSAPNALSSDNPGNRFYDPFGKLSAAPADAASSFADRFAKWGSVPKGDAQPVTSDAPATFDSRFGNWGSVPAGNFGDISSPALRAIEKERRSMAPDEFAPASAQAATTALAFQPDNAGTGGVLWKYFDPNLIAPAQGASPSESQSQGSAAPAWPTDGAGIANGQPVHFLGRRTYNPSLGSVSNVGAPASPKSDGEFSLNDAYLEYRRRLDATPSRVPA